jgi:hypothetical protein
MKPWNRSLIPRADDGSVPSFENWPWQSRAAIAGFTALMGLCATGYLDANPSASLAAWVPAVVGIGGAVLILFELLLFLVLLGLFTLIVWGAVSLAQLVLPDHSSMRTFDAVTLVLLGYCAIQLTVIRKKLDKQ